MVELVLGSPLLFSYAVHYSLAADAFVAASLSAATIFYVTVRRPRLPLGRVYAPRPTELRIARWLGGLGAIGCVLLCANAGLSLSLADFVTNLSAIRTDNFDRLADSGNPAGHIAFVAAVIASCGVLTIIASVRVGRDGGRLLRWLAAINFVLLTIVSLGVYAGRATIVNIVLLAVISLYLSGRRVSAFRPRTFAIAGLTLISAWYLATTFLGTRETNTNAVAILDGTQRAQTRPWIQHAIENDESLGLAVVSLGYFASPIPTLAFYIDGPVPGPFYGRYSYPLISRAVGSLTGTWSRDEWFTTRQEIYAPIEARNYFGNVWATLLRDLLVDFGYIGATMFCAALGAFIAWARNQYERVGSLHYHYFEVLGTFTLGFGAFTSFLWSSFLAVPFFLALIIMVALRVSLRSAPTERLAPAGRPHAEA